MRQITIIVGLLSLTLATACGGGGGDDNTGSGDLTIQASVAAPTLTSENVNVPLGGLGRNALVPSLRRQVTEEPPPEGSIVHAEDLAGNELENVEPAETDENGDCELTGFTTEQLEEGVRLVTEYTDAEGNDVELHAPVFPSEDDIASGTPIEEPVSPTTDLIDALAIDSCGGSLENCDGETHNMEVLVDVINAVITGEAPEDPTNVEGNAEALREIYAEQLAGGDNPHDPLVTALGGDTAPIIEQVGETAEANDITYTTADMVTNTDTGLGAIIETYAAPDDTTWEEMRVEGVDPVAMVGCMMFLPPEAIGEFASEDFRQMARTIPEVEGGPDMMAIPAAQQACAESFQQGAYDGCADDPDLCGAAAGIMFATFPPCPESGCGAMTPEDFTNINFSPQTAGAACAIGILALDCRTNNTCGNYPPNDMRQNLNGTMSDRTNAQSCANGGCNDFFGGMNTAGSASNFVPGNFTGEILAPPGGVCDADHPCLPCDSCTGGICVAGSPNMGSACSNTEDDCDDMTVCRTGPVASLGGQCMCASVCPAGAPVVETAGAETVDSRPPENGATGAQCGTGLPACTGGGTCSGTTAGTCITSSFCRGSLSPCTNNADCCSQSCSSNVCAYISTNTNCKAVEENCQGPADCCSGLCSPSLGKCEAPPTTGILAGASSNLKADGQTCGTPSECASAFCCVSTLTCTQSSSCTTTTTTTGGTTTGGTTTDGTTTGGTTTVGTTTGTTTGGTTGGTTTGGTTTGGTTGAPPPPPPGGGSGLPGGSPCTGNSMCASAICLNGFCSAPPTVM